MSQIIQFQITKGEEYYVAQGIGFPIVTQGKTLDELTDNIREAVAVHLEGENLSEIGLGSYPSVLINYELPQVCEHV
jgi:predicted RNase H-like HicB family nuclease